MKAIQHHDVPSSFAAAPVAAVPSDADHAKA
jgi:hypothetical protein